MYDIACLVLHDGYENQRPYPNDIALIKLPSSVITNANVVPIDLPSRGEFSDDSMCHITGWGYTGKYNVGR